MSWVIYLSISIICFTSLNLLQRLIAVEAQNTRATSIIFNLYAALITIAINLFLGSLNIPSLLPNHSTAWVVLLIAAACYGFYERYRFKTAQLLEASTLSLVSNIVTPVAFVGSIFLYQESITYSKLAGGSIIILALVLATFERKSSPNALKGIMLGLLINATVGIGVMLDKLGTQFFSANTYSILLWTVPLIFILPPIPSSKTLRVAIKEGSWKTPTLAGLNAVAYFSLLRSYELADATLIIPLSQLSVLLTVICGAVFLRETSHLPQKIIAGGLAITGVFLLV